MIKINTIFSFIFIMIFYFVLSAKINFIKDEKLRRIILFFYSLIFFIFLTIGTLSNVKISQSSISISRIERQEKSKHISTSFRHLPLSDIIINIFMLFPIGTILNLSYSKKKKYSSKILLSIIIGAIIGTTIEILQLFLKANRVSQISDILFNSISTMIGTCFSESILNHKKKLKQF